MKNCAALVLVLVLAAAAQASAVDLTSAKNRPVTKVVTLLKDMQNELEKEADDDQEIYEQMMCWCTTNDKAKTTAISDGEQRSVDLTAAIDGGTASSARLNVEIKATDEEVAKNNGALEQATELRRKENFEFSGDEMDMLQSIGALKSAVTVLSKHHSALLQVKDGAEVQETSADSNELIKVKVLLQQTLRKHADMLGEVITPRQRRALAAFAEETYANQKKPEGPQGGEVFGILKNMKETFEANLAAAQREESESLAAYSDLKAAKESEIAAGTTLSRMKTNELGATDEKLANDKQDLEDTQNNLEADREFLGSLKEKCQMFDNEFAARTKNRQDEIGAVSKAMAVLTSDDAHDTFTRTLGAAASFVQEKAFSDRRDRAVRQLVATAKRLNDPKLSAAAMSVRLAGFGKVKDDVNNMIARLTIEKEDEVEHKDWCNDGIRKNERQTEEQERDKEGLVVKIEDLDNTMATLTAAIDQLKADVTQTQVQMKKVGEDREAASKEFQVTVADQRATQELLTNALNVLKGYYDTKLVQVSQHESIRQPAGPPPPTGFKKYEKSNTSGGVMGMIQQIIDDAKAMEEEAIADEDSAAQAYHDFVKESNESITAMTKDIMNKSETKAQAEADKGEAMTSLEYTLSELKMSANESRDLHSSCDFVLKNFDVRQSARDDEIEALKQTVAILSGASFGFMQRK